MALDDVYNTIFSDDKRTGALSPEELQTRRKLAYALATRNRPFPKTIGEGLTALGEAWGERGSNQELARLEEQQRERDQQYLNPKPVTAVPPVAGIVPEDATPVVPTSPTQAPPGVAPGPSNLPVVPPGQPQIPPQRPVAPIRQAMGGAQDMLRAQPEGPVGSPEIPVGVRDQLARSLAGPSAALAGGEGARPAEMPPGQAAPPPRALAAPPAPEPTGTAVAGLAQAADARGDLASAALAQAPPGAMGLPVTAPEVPGPAQQQIAQAPPPVARPPVLSPEDRYPEATKILGPLRPEPKPPVAPQETDRERQLRVGAPFASGSVGASGLALATEMKEKRQAAHAQAMEQYKLDRSAWDLEHNKYSTFELAGPERRAKLAQEAQALKDKQQADKLRAEFGDVPMEVLTKRIEKSTEDVKALPQAAQALQDVRTQLDKGMFTGLFAPGRVLAEKAKGLVTGVTDPRVVATETFLAAGKPLLAAARQAQSGGANISDNDMKLASQAIAGDITLEGDTMRNVMNALERIQLQTALHHQGIISTVAGSDPNRANALYGSFGIPINTMERLVPKEAIDTLLSDPSSQNVQHFNNAFKTPKLAETIIMRRQQR